MHRVYLDLNRPEPVYITAETVEVEGVRYYRCSHDKSLRRIESEPTIRGSDILATAWHEDRMAAWEEADGLLAEVAGRIDELRQRCRRRIEDAQGVA